MVARSLERGFGIRLIHADITPTRAKMGFRAKSGESLLARLRPETDDITLTEDMIVIDACAVDRKGVARRSADVLARVLMGGLADDANLAGEWDLDADGFTAV